MDESLRSRLQKLRNLAERGVGGEKETAEKKLKQLLKANGITEADLNQDNENFYIISYKYPYRLKLLGQIIYTVLGAEKGIQYYRCKGTRNKIGIYCTAAQKLEIELDFEFYCNLLDEELDILISAFIEKQNLYPKDSPVEFINSSELTEKQKQDILKKKAYADNIKKRTRSLMIEEN